MFLHVKFTRILPLNMYLFFAVIELWWYVDVCFYCLQWNGYWHLWESFILVTTRWRQSSIRVSKIETLCQNFLQGDYIECKFYNVHSIIYIHYLVSEYVGEMLITTKQLIDLRRYNFKRVERKIWAYSS